MSTNHSFWQDKAGVQGAIRESAVPSKVADSELVVKVHAWAVNPADAVVQDMPLPFITYPLILGEDVAGTIEVVGSAAASKFKVGDRILAMAFGAVVMKPEQGGFQDYVILDHTLACKIPDSLSFNDASVFPLCIATAAHGLFSKDYLGMPFPKVNSTSTGKSVFIWEGSSGVGSNAIQLSKAAGFAVITTCSARNFDYVKSLGADKVFDYNSPSANNDIAAELDKGTCIGIFQAAGQVAPACQVAHKSKQKLFVAASNPVPEWAAQEGVEAKMIFASGGAVIYHETSPATFGAFLPEALAKGLYKVAPVPEVVPTKGLEGIQEALDILKKGVSAKKIVIEAK
ncbi:oxidoreductase [Lipomyces starkeyi]